MLLPVNGSYLEAFQQSADPQSKKVLDALERTLRKFDGAAEKPTIKEAILRLFVLNNAKHIIPTDPETTKLIEILDDFTKELND